MAFLQAQQSEQIGIYCLLNIKTNDKQLNNDNSTTNNMKTPQSHSTVYEHKQQKNLQVNRMKTIHKHNMIFSDYS